MTNPIPIKTPQEIDSMRRGGHLLGQILSYIKKTATPGMSTYTLDQLTRQKFAELGAKPSFLGMYGFPAYICTSLNDEVVHGIPSQNKIIQTGDLLKVDCGVLLDNLHTDSAITIRIGEVSPQAEHLASTTESALAAGIAAAHPGNHVGDISAAIQTVLESAGFGVVRECTGHGVGHNLHEPPTIENFGTPGTGPILRPGMTLAIEPISTAGHYTIRELPDHWTLTTRDSSLSAHAEHTILITKNKPEILTQP